MTIFYYRKDSPFHTKKTMEKCMPAKKLLEQLINVNICKDNKTLIACKSNFAGCPCGAAS